MVARHKTCVVYVVALLTLGLWPVTPVSAQSDYVVGPSDVLAITAPGDASLTGRFTVETDDTFTYPLIGRVRAGGLTLRALEAELRSQLTDGGFYQNPEILISVEEYRNQNVFVLGEVQAPGMYSLSGELRLTDVLALTGSTLPTAGGEAVIVPAGSGGMADASSFAIGRGPSDAAGASASPVTRVNLHDLQDGAFSGNVLLNDGDAVFILRAGTIYLSGQVRNPGAYVLQNSDTTVLQGLSLAGGVTDLGARSRVEIVRIVDGEPTKIKVDLSETVLPGDTIVVPQTRF